MDTGGSCFCADEVCFAGVDPVQRGCPLAVFLEANLCLSGNRQALLPGCGQQSGQLVALMCVGVGTWFAGNDIPGARHKCQFDQ